MNEVWLQAEKKEPSSTNTIALFFCPTCDEEIRWLNAFAELEIEWRGSYSIEEDEIEWTDSYTDMDKNDVAEYYCPNCGSHIDPDEIVDKNVPVDE